MWKKTTRFKGHHVINLELQQNRSRCKASFSLSRWVEQYSCNMHSITEVAKSLLRS